MLAFFLSLLSLNVNRMLEKRSLSYVDGAIPVPVDDAFLAENVQRICICDTGIHFSFSLSFSFLEFIEENK